MPTSGMSAAPCTRAGAAEGDQREVARIVAALDRQQPDAAGHALVDDGEDRLRRLLDAEPELGAELADGGARALKVEACAALDPDRAVSD